MYNDTHWYGKFNMFSRWLELVDICQMINHEIGTDGSNDKPIPMEVPQGMHCKYLVAKVQKYTQFLGYFHHTDLELQKKLIRLAECREQLNGWVLQKEEAEEEDANWELYSHLELKYIHNDSPIVRDVHFERGVVKI
jgi:hypothetical protein